MNLSTVTSIRTNKRMNSLINKHNKLSAKLKVIGPLVDSVYSTELKKYSFHKKNRDGSIGEKITNHNVLYRSVEDTTTYHESVNEILLSKPYSKGLKKGYCPKLVLENDLRKLESEVISFVKEKFSMPEIYELKIEKEIFDLTRRLLIK